MKNQHEKNIDEILNTMKDRPIPENGFKSVDEFKSEFFKRAARSDQRSSRIVKGFFWTASTAAAAGFLFYVSAPMSALFAPLSHTISGGVTDTSVACTSSTVSYHRTSGAKAHASAVYSDVATSNTGAMDWNDSSADSWGAVGIKRQSPVKLRSMPDPVPLPQINYNTEEYKHLNEKGFIRSIDNPLSTFGADVDTASYTNVRRFLLKSNRLPPQDAVRIEEFLNYFQYKYPAPQGNARFNVHFESMNAPWAPERKLLLAGVQAKKVEKSALPPSNFVFLIDNSGSMAREFPLVKEAMGTLASQMRPEDRISIVTYGGGVSTLLDGGSGEDKEQVKRKISSLRVGGFTPGSAGIQRAYQLAHQHFIKGGNNRIVLITDGDFNVGVSSESELVDLVEKERSSGIYLSAFGVGYGNYKDNKLKMLANKGNGNYSYLDNPREARRVMVNEMNGKMFTLAKDVKFQIEFNPAQVAAYRLIGYELRELAARDFNDDTKDSGEVGVGHQVTALYELIMNDADAKVKKQYLGNVDTLKYQKSAVGTSPEILTFKLRYQLPEGTRPSRLQTFTVKSLPASADNIQWASAVAEFGMLLRNSEFKGNADYASLRRRAQKFIGDDQDGKRAEFLNMVKVAEDL